MSESTRLNETREGKAAWKRWGPYLSERQWGTVREDYSADGKSWTTLADLTGYAVRANPSIRAAQAAWRGSVEQYRVATGLPDPQLTALLRDVRITVGDGKVVVTNRATGGVIFTGSTRDLEHGTFTRS